MKSSKNRIVYRFLCMLFVLSFLVVLAEKHHIKADNEDGQLFIYDGLKFIIDEENKTASVAGSESESLTKLTVPDTIYYGEAYIPVTGIDEYAFQGSSLKTINLGANITYIGEGAFSFSENIKKVSIPKKCERIDDAAFFMCTGLKTVSINKKGVLSVIGSGAFAGTAVTSIAIPNATVTLGDAAFAECNALKSVTIGKKLKNFGTGAFAGCNALTKITISDKNKYFLADENIIYTKDRTELECGAAASGELKISEGTVKVAERAFEANTKITSLELPDSLETVGEGAFINCTSLKELKLIGGLKELGENAFYGIEELKFVQLSQGEGQYED